MNTRSSRGTDAAETDCNKALRDDSRNATAMAVSSPCASASLSALSACCCGVNATELDVVLVLVVVVVVVFVDVAVDFALPLLPAGVVALPVATTELSCSDCDSASAINKSVSSESSDDISRLRNSHRKTCALHSLFVFREGISQRRRRARSHQSATDRNRRTSSTTQLLL